MKSAMKTIYDFAVANNVDVSVSFLKETPRFAIRLEKDDYKINRILDAEVLTEPHKVVVQTTLDGMLHELEKRKPLTPIFVGFDERNIEIRYKCPACGAPFGTRDIHKGGWSCPCCNQLLDMEGVDEYDKRRT